MNNILLVDDDAFFRSMFAGILDWAKYGYRVVQAENGQDAIRLMSGESCPFELVFTDMDMPIIDGVELTQYIGRYFPEVRCVALSAYDDFDYVKSSLRSGAEDYILKYSLTREQLLALISKDAAESSNNRPPDEPHTDARRTHFLTDFIMGCYLGAPMLPELFRSMGIPAFEKDLLLFAITFQNGSALIARSGSLSRSSMPMRILTGMIQGILDRLGEGVAFFNAEHKALYAILASHAFSDVHFAAQSAALFVEQTENAVARYFNQKITVHSAPLCHKLEDIPKAYATLASETGAPHDTPLSEGVLLVPAAEYLMGVLLYGTEGTVRQRIGAYYNAGRYAQYTHAQFSALTKLFYTAWTICAGRQDSVKYAALAGLRTNERERLFMEELFVSLHIELSANEKKRLSPLVYRAQCVIEQSLEEGDLSLAGIAQCLNASPAYLSRVFKKEIGESITEAINLARIVRAKELLSGFGHTVKEVSKKCGFDNYSYFFKIFKRCVGITPKEYAAGESTALAQKNSKQDEDVSPFM